MKTTTNRWTLRCKTTHTVASLVVGTKARMARILLNSGRTDLELVRVNW